MRTAPHRAPGHGCVLRIGGAAALSGSRRPAAGDRRQPPGAWAARARAVRAAARLCRPWRGDDRKLRGTRVRRALRDGTDAGRAAVSPGGHPAGGLR